MYNRTKNKGILAFLLALCLIVTSLSVTIFASDGELTPPPGCSLVQSMKYLVEECGPRLRGTPNEAKAAQYVRDRFVEWGYKGVRWETPAITSGSLTSVNRMVLAQGPEIYGNSSPTALDVTTFSGKLVDLGTHTDYEIPVGTTGDIVGAVRFSAAPTAALINGIISDINANPGVNMTGVFFTRTDGTAPYSAHPAAVTGLNLPAFSSVLSSFERALAYKDNIVIKAERGLTFPDTNVVIAKKPAATNNPDMLIVISAHLDSVITSPGSNDNASGTAALIELARRFAKVDFGNTEVWFASVGSEEGNGMRGAVYVAEEVIAECKRDIAININMDMLASSLTARTGSNALLNATSMDINVTASNLTLNLPAYLVTNFAKDVEWAPGHDNVRIYNYGGSDHVQFHTRGIEAASMIVVLNSDDDIENAANGYHSGRDNLVENYSYERHLMNVNLVANGLWKAIDQKVTKTAKFRFETSSNNSVTLANASDIFQTWDSVNAVFTDVDTGTATNVTFTSTNRNVALPGGEGYVISGIVANGTGIADNLNATRNTQLQNMRTPMVAKVVAPTAYVKGPAQIYSSDKTATYTFGLEWMPQQISTIEVKFRVESNELFPSGSVTALHNFLNNPAFDSGWVMVGANFERELTLLRPGENTSESFDFLELVLDIKDGAEGTAKVEIMQISPSRPGGVVSTEIVNATTTVLAYSKFDGNRDGTVDLADVAAAAYYFGMMDDDPRWNVAEEFETNDPSVKISIVPMHSNVNDDDVIDIEDIIQIILNYSNP